MSEAPSASPNNPISLEPGVDLNIRTYLHGLFEAHHSEPGFTLDDWKGWSDAEQAGAIRALAQDYLEGAGGGFDWVSAGQQAEFMLAATYHEVAYSVGIQPPPRLYLNFFDPFIGEGFELQMEAPSDIPMDPVPGAPVAEAPTDSRRARAVLMIPPSGDALKAVDMALVTGLRQFSEFFTATHRLPLMFMGAALTLWKALQVSHHVRAGAVFRGITNPQMPSLPEGSMRIVYARSGPRIVDVVAANPADSTLYLD